MHFPQDASIHKDRCSVQLFKLLKLYNDQNQLVCLRDVDSKWKNSAVPKEDGRTK